jgi:putative endonuclease
MLSFMEKVFYIYIMASESGTLYTGVTSNLEKRVYEHKNGVFDGFSKKYGCKKLVYFEEGTQATPSFEREKQIKGWRREKKEALIRISNPGWRDLSELF